MNGGIPQLKWVGNIIIWCVLIHNRWINIINLFKLCNVWSLTVILRQSPSLHSLRHYILHHSPPFLDIHHLQSNMVEYFRAIFISWMNFFRSTFVFVQFSLVEWMFSVALEPRGQRGRLTPHFLEHGVERGQGHRISDNWIGGSYSILADIALENIIFAWHCRNIGK